MSYLDRRDLLSADLMTRSISKEGSIKYYNSDKNVANIYMKLMAESPDGAQKEVSVDEASNYTVTIDAIKSKTNQIRTVPGVLSNDLTDETCAIWKFELGEDLTNQIGEVICQTYVKNTTQNLTMRYFAYTVEADKLTGLNSEIVTDPDLPILKELIKEVQETAQTVNNIDNVNVSDTKTYSNKKIEEKFSGVDAQFNTIEQNVSTSLVNSSDALAKADNPIGAISSKGQKIPYSMLDEKTIQAISGTTTISVNAGYEKNRGVDFPLKSATRDGVISPSSDKIKNGILNIKVNGAKIGKYYRLEWLGNGVDIGGGTRFDILLSEYDKASYIGSSATNKRDLIILNDGLGLNQAGGTTGIITRRYDSLRDNIGIEITYDGDVIGTYLGINQSGGAGYSFIIDESCYYYQNQLYPLVCKKNNDVIQLAYKYNKDNDLRISFEKFGSNNLLQIAYVQIISSSNPTVNPNFNINPSKTLVNKITDSISPYMLKSVNNADGDKVSTSEYDFVGGCHGYNNGANDTIATARMIFYKIRVDGKDISENGIYGANKIDIIVTNRIQGNNTKKADGTGREILEEKIIYTITQGKISVINEIKALEDVKIYRNYGLQCYVLNWKTNGKVYFVDGVDFLEKPLDSNAHAGTKGENSNCRKICLTDGSDKLIMSLDLNGLGYKRYINDIDKTAFWSNDKLYFHLINNYITIPLNGKIFYSGSWEFISE